MQGTLFADIADSSEAWQVLAKAIKKEWVAFHYKWIWRDRKPNKDGLYSYRSVKQMFKEFDNKAPYQKLYYAIRNRFQRIFEFPEDKYRAVKRGIQRGYRGYADEDLWHLSGYLSRVITPALAKLKEIKHGTPMAAFEEADGVDEHGNPTDEASKKAEERWDNILADMIFTFHIAELIIDRNYDYIPTKDWTNEEYNRRKKICKQCDMILLTYAESERYERGWKYFQEHFFSLWD